MYIFKEAETWVAVAFILFLIILFRFGWSKIVKALDNRAETIRKELNEARNLREQAQSLLADYQKKKQESENEIDKIIQKAKSEADITFKNSIQNHKDLLERRKKTAEEKISQAKERVIQDIKESIVDISVNTTEALLKENINESNNKKLVKEASDKIDKDFLNI
ncbi:MAG: ATP synthase subunit b [Alphaproteobacteria bacterium MarineAlpha2_Bin1]|nr:MAG: ATP synthase subunit b [Alphaproteobacteria bacterium MarineAlpha2_Bin1]